jgi:outer membrane protein OmpA-like peptidoglycan-associated protein
MKSNTAFLAAGILFAPLAAMAQPITGPYISLGVGPNYFEGQNVKSVSIPALGLSATSLGKTSSNVDVGVGGALGWGFGNGFRVEVQGDYLRGTFSHTEGASADQEVYGGFGNALYDFDLTSAGLPGLTPYLGVGIGYQESSINGTIPVFGYTPKLTSSGTGDFAVQGIAGIAFNISDVPGLAITAEYHFVAIPEDLNYKASLAYAGLETPVRFKTDGLYSHVGLLGLRYALWQPAPPPPPAPEAAPPPPAPEAARTYLVFFDWDRADLTERARQIVAEAATASTHVATTKIEVNGYTDLSGTAAYNLKLSVRRAKSVEAELIKDGVAASEIAIHGYGESDPLVPTAKGVREPQNRRVEIILNK